MNYHFDDLRRLLAQAPWLHLGRAKFTERLLLRAVSEGDELATILSQYPEVRYEPLDFHYLCLQSIGALHRDLFDDLTSYFGEQGRAWVNFHMMLSPQPWAKERIEALRVKAPQSPWIEEIVLARANGRQSQYLVLAKLLDRLAAQLAPLNKPVIVLRGAPDPIAWRAHAARVKAAYAAGGSSAALSLIRLAT